MSAAGLPEWKQKEAYRITVKKNGVVIEAAADEGVFRARQTLRQMRLLGGDIPCCTWEEFEEFKKRN